METVKVQGKIKVNVCVEVLSDCNPITKTHFNERLGLCQQYIRVLVCLCMK